MPMCNIFLFIITSHQYIFKDTKYVAQVVYDVNIYFKNLCCMCNHIV